MTGIFINYRSDDDGFAAALVDKTLCEVFGERQVFRDSRSLKASVDFPPELWRRLFESNVLVVLIGSVWSTLASEDGTPRIENPRDYVRCELAEALRRGITVLPVLLNDAPWPKASSLPADIRPICQRQYERLRLRHSEQDLEHLVAELRRLAPALPASDFSLAEHQQKVPGDTKRGGFQIIGGATIHGDAVSGDKTVRMGRE